MPSETLWNKTDGDFATEFLSSCMTPTELTQFQTQSRNCPLKERYKSLSCVGGAASSLRDQVRRKLLLIVLAWTDDNVGGVGEQ